MWIRGLVAHHLGWGGFKKLRKVGRLLGYLTAGGGGGVFLMRESGRVVPLCTGAGAAPGHPSHATAGNATHSVITQAMEFGGCAPPQIWEMYYRAKGRAGGGGGLPTQRPFMSKDVSPVMALVMKNVFRVTRKSQHSK